MTNAILKNGYASKAGVITTYNYDAVTGEYTGSSDEYLPVGVGLPAHSTNIMPLADKTGHAVVFSQNGWEYIADRRGETVYSTITGLAVMVNYLGNIAEGFTPVAPSTPFDKWNGVAWVTDTDAQSAALLAENNAIKNTLLMEARQIIEPLKYAADGGYIDDADKPRLIEWQRYLYVLSKVDPSKPAWPEKPV
ncbi:Prophage tail fiber assembly protein TfaE [Enterobacter cloacae]|uniref:tail fiber assembly protein n=1 Tax=Citrobacter freundii TaxID=546 RepID=UPI001BCCE928|nr:tail fiber assembly protein [Citrobacter freundii]CAE7049254.1 Prophage tail fiber assembly protein TfaE [Enterobacter cloacae]CAE7460889.1 Prophage tail fiber assembly protein TfaE [Enterobacter cloacae]CAE7479605.1 Prophage tail fiber assembly protein TfaE [Enterobacter cloacae]CAH3485508.1 Prophage tail fiber assembly protein TfaE [Enterobacter cloacae]CAH3486260.1 Prophage tail fiber assembly protein TfaE [Enterobacter cloacae]